MRPDDYTAGVELFQATGSLIARPQRIVPVVILPAVVLWVPVAPLSVPDVWPEVQTWRNDLLEQTLHRFERETERRPPPLPEWFPPAVPDVGPIPERQHVGSRITFLYPSPEMDVTARRFEAALAALFGPPDMVSQLREHTPPDEDLVATLLDFARAGDEGAFRDLALMRGVPAGEIPAMWEGTVKRVGAKLNTNGG